MSDAPFPVSIAPGQATGIRWHDWSAEAFALAQREGRPVLLFLTAWWSDASRAADTLLADPMLSALLTDRFVSMRVDVDERPDIAVRYGDGSVPAITILTPDGEVMGDVPVTDAPAIAAALETMLDDWHMRRDGVVQGIEAARAMRAAERAAARAQRSPGILTPAILDIAVEHVDSRYDEGVPGVVDPGAPLRFPQAASLRLWRYAHHRRGHQGALDHAKATWSAMTEGGLFDPEGGIFHAAVASGWSQPVREKHARDQGALLQVAGELALSDLDWRDEQRETVQAVVDYLGGTLSDAQGGIGHAQRAPEATPKAFEDGRSDEPPVDHRVFTGSCAVAARGLIGAGVAFDRRDWMDHGLRAVDFLLTHARAGQAGMYHAFDGGPSLLGILDDQAQMLLALIDAYEVTGQPSYLDHARWLARVMDDGWLEPGIGFRDVPFDHEDTALLAEPLVPLEANVAAAEGFLTLARLTHDARYIGTAADVLGAFAHGIEARGLAAADFARVTDRLLSAEPEFKIVSEWPAGEPDRVADPLHHAALRLPLASRTVQRLNPEQDDLLFYSLGIPRDAVKVAYVCTGQICSQAVVQPESLLAAVDEVLATPSW
ncbi:MAG: thioredoxin family protein [Chloroflexi bacterium]|nr:thioredoxin family protein [Chloroflexota bacterium]MDA1239295.1 thioredoxin family protein [Chloroflexota bacterium]